MAWATSPGGHALLAGRRLEPGDLRRGPHVERLAPRLHEEHFPIGVQGRRREAVAREGRLRPLAGGDLLQRSRRVPGRIPPAPFLEIRKGRGSIGQGEVDEDRPPVKVPPRPRREVVGEPVHAEARRDHGAVRDRQDEVQPFHRFSCLPAAPEACAGLNRSEFPTDPGRPGDPRGSGTRRDRSRRRSASRCRRARRGS